MSDEKPKVVWLTRKEIADISGYSECTIKTIINNLQSSLSRRKRSIFSRGKRPDEYLIRPSNCELLRISQNNFENYIAKTNRSEEDKKTPSKTIEQETPIKQQTYQKQISKSFFPENQPILSTYPEVNTLSHCQGVLFDQLGIRQHSKGYKSLVSAGLINESGSPEEIASSFRRLIEEMRDENDTYECFDFSTLKQNQQINLHMESLLEQLVNSEDLRNIGYLGIESDKPFYVINLKPGTRDKVAKVLGLEKI